MLDTYSRKYVEAIREADTIKIIINEGKPDELTLTPSRSNWRFKKLLHDIRLAFQDYYNNADYGTRQPVQWNRRP